MFSVLFISTIIYSLTPIVDRVILIFSIHVLHTCLKISIKFQFDNLWKHRRTVCYARFNRAILDCTKEFPLKLRWELIFFFIIVPIVRYHSHKSYEIRARKTGRFIGELIIKRNSVFKRRVIHNYGNRC